MDKFDMLKSHIDAYTRKDGTVVQAHDDSRVASSPMETHPSHDDASSRMIQHGMDLEDRGYARHSSTFVGGNVKNGYSADYHHPDGRKATISMRRSTSAKGAWDTSVQHH